MLNSQTSRIISAALVAVVLAVGCGTTTETTEPVAAPEPVVEAPATTSAPTTTESTTTAPAETTTEAPATAAPDADAVSAILVGGGQIDLNSIEGSDTVLWFWAPW